MKVVLPTPLAEYTAHRREVEAEGATLAELLADLDRRFPGIRFRVIDEQDAIRPHIKIFVNRVQAPTLITWGRDDRVSPLDMALLPMRTIPNAELHVFPNCGHWTMIEAKEAFESAVLAFLLRQ